MIVTTHYLDEAERRQIAVLCTRALGGAGQRRRAGSVFVGAPCWKRAAPCHRADAQASLEDARRPRHSAFSTRLHVVVEDAERGLADVRRALEADGNVSAQVERIVPSLEDVFIHSERAEREQGAASGRHREEDLGRGAQGVPAGAARSAHPRDAPRPAHVHALVTATRSTST
ncbi:MAG: hypothetical protein U0610_08715 [bacterium]